MNGMELVQGFIQRGYTPWQAAALAGHIAQESGGDPSAINPKEDAHGLLQFRLDRWGNLQKFAKDSGRSPTDPQAQMDFIRHEMTNGSEAKAGSSFLAAPDVASASAALKPYIRFGDDSAGTRLANANGLFQQIGAPPAAVGALASAAPANSLGGAVTAGAPVGALAAPPPAAAPTMAQGLGALGKTLAGAAPQFDPVQPLQIPQANAGQSQQIAAALAKTYGIGA